MKMFLFLVLAFNFAQAEVIDLKEGTSTYEVKHLIKKVQGESHELKGKIMCPSSECEFLIAVPVASFVSSDSNRDLNMRTTVEASKYPYTTARGTFPKANLSLKKWVLPVEVEFHGVKKPYQAQVEKTGENQMSANFDLMLDAHKVERPSLFGMKINDDVKMNFKLQW